MPAIVLAALVAGGVATMRFSVPDLAYAARWAGTPGVFTAQGCEQVPRSRGASPECWGTFRPDDGEPVADAEISAALAVGDAVPVQRTADGGYLRVGVSACCAWLTVTLFGVVLAGTGLLSLWSIAGRGRVRRGWMVVLVAAAGALISAVVGAIAAALE